LRSSLQALSTNINKKIIAGILLTLNVAITSSC
jgi:hypothetical protein